LLVQVLLLALALLAQILLLALALLIQVLLLALALLAQILLLALALLIQLLLLALALLAQVLLLALALLAALWRLTGGLVALALLLAALRLRLLALLAALRLCLRALLLRTLLRLTAALLLRALTAALLRRLRSATGASGAAAGLCASRHILRGRRGKSCQERRRADEQSVPHGMFLIHLAFIPALPPLLGRLWGNDRRGALFRNHTRIDVIIVAGSLLFRCAPAQAGTRANDIAARAFHPGTKFKPATQQRKK